MRLVIIARTQHIQHIQKTRALQGPWWALGAAMLLILVLLGAILIVRLRRRLRAMARGQGDPRQAQAAPGESEWRFRQMAEAIHEVFWMTEPKSAKILYVSPAYETIWQRPIEALYEDPQAWMQAIHEEDVETVRASWERQVQGIATREEFRILRPDGTVRWIENRSYPILNEEGKVQRVTGVAADITARKRTEQELAFLSSIVEQVRDAVIITDTGFEITYANQAVEELYGYRREELIGQRPDVLNAEQLGERIQQSIYTTLQAGQVWVGEHLNRRKDGSTFICEMRISPLVDEGRVLIGYIGLQRDVTERVAAERQLRQSEQRFRTIFNSVNDAVWIVSLDGDLLDVNRTAAQALGYTREAMRARPIADFLSDEERGKVAERLATVRSQGQALFETRHVRKDGAHIPVEVNARLTDFGDGPVLLSVIRDIAERQQAERQIRAALDEKVTLLQELYHRTKNNMEVICAMLDLQAAHVTDPRLLAAFKETQNRIRSMALVHQKLYQSQNLSHINLGSYMADLARLLLESYHVPSRRITLELDVEDVFVQIDTAIPCGLIMNELISNALIHAFPADGEGKITVAVHRPADKQIELRVADDGVGLPAGFDARHPETFGLMTVFALGEEQLQGEVTLAPGPGVAWRVRFSDDLYEPRL